MGKNTDKLYITQSEHSGVHGWHAGMSGIAKRKAASSRPQLPFNYCALSLQPFTHPCCVLDSENVATLFDFRHIVPWIKKHGTNPVTKEPLTVGQLMKLNFTKNATGEYCDPVTMKVFNQYTHIVAIKPTGNCFAYDTIENLNIKPKNWKDLVTDIPFQRSDIITVQELGRLPNQQSSTKDVSKEERIKQAKEAVQRSRERRALGENATASSQSSGKTENTSSLLPTHKAIHTKGLAASALTSTSFSPVTRNEHAIISEEDYMLVPKRIWHKGYARLVTNFGEINLELHTEYAPRAVYNFVELAKKGYYDGTKFHRNIPGFMIQGGDPTATGRGGQSIWGKPFRDEVTNPLTHDSRGVVSMANSGKNTNGSQFFICYDAAKHLDRKHTIFGRVVGGMSVLDAMERVPTTETDRPKTTIQIENIVIYVDPFELWREEEQQKVKEKEKHESSLHDEENDRVTWTGKRLGITGESSSGSSSSVPVGKYIKAAEEKKTSFVEPSLPKKKKARTGFGNFDAW